MYRVANSLHGSACILYICLYEPEVYLCEVYVYESEVYVYESEVYVYESEVYVYEPEVYMYIYRPLLPTYIFITC